MAYFCSLVLQDQGLGKMNKSATLWSKSAGFFDLFAQVWIHFMVIFLHSCFHAFFSSRLFKTTRSLHTFFLNLLFWLGKKDPDSHQFDARWATCASGCKPTLTLYQLAEKSTCASGSRATIFGQLGAEKSASLRFVLMDNVTFFISSIWSI